MRVILEASEKGKRGRGAAGKVLVFGFLQRGGNGFVLPVPDARSDTLMPIIRRKIMPERIVYTDIFRSYNVLDISQFKHYCINHSHLFAKKKNQKKSEKIISMAYQGRFLLVLKRMQVQVQSRITRRANQNSTKLDRTPT